MRYTKRRCILAAVRNTDPATAPATTGSASDSATGGSGATAGSARASDDQLPRQLGVADLALTATGIVIGSGIFLVPGLVLQHSGLNPGAALGVWAAGGILTLFGALTYAELSTIRPEAGGIYAYIRDAFGPLPAFLYGWSAFFVIATGALATLAVAFTAYLGQFVPLTNLQSRIVSVLVIAGLAAINVAGTRRSVTLQNVTTITKLAAILVLAGVLVVRGDASAASTTATPATSLTLSGLGTAMISVLWAYEGWQYVTCMAADARDPQRTFPKAIGLALGGVLLIYLITNFSYIAALGTSAVASSSRVASDAVVATLGSSAANAVTFLILLSILSSANGSVLAPGRLYFAMARDGVFFKKLGHLSPTRKTPAFAIVAGATWSMVGAALGTFEQLLTYVVFAAWIFYGLGALSIFVYRARERRGEPRAAFRVPGYPVTPLLFALAAFALVVNTIVAQPQRAAVGLAIVFSGTPAFYWWRARSSKRDSAS